VRACSSVRMRACKRGRGAGGKVTNLSTPKAPHHHTTCVIPGLLKALVVKGVALGNGGFHNELSSLAGRTANAGAAGAENCGV